LLNTELKIILLDYQNNFVETLKISSNAEKNFDVLIGLNVLPTYNYSDRLKNYFSGLYSAKILDLSAKPFFL